MTSDPLYDFLYYGAQFFTAFFTLGVASIVMDDLADDDDDDGGGGMLQPCYVTNR